jgi:membrane fusion protein, multidrug efflux system
MRARSNTIRLIVVIAIIAAAAGGAVALTRRSSLHAAPVHPTPVAAPAAGVVAASVKSGDVPIYLRGVGTVIAYNAVLVRSQITGQLVKIDFHQGQTVKEGDVRVCGVSRFRNFGWCGGGLYPLARGAAPALSGGG